ncbi:WD-40 repeat-containing protein MSI4 [Sesamum angolense]|uniref:WD-40 repeat-containing protein MSI4 n=1 Tax=Sesamum angolense TaxID=2727404 RepID=A0AAE1WKP6_9LAMI|nr:WD-40 repeat-containing protein MSI4 [Sesamum angolense]
MSKRTPQPAADKSYVNWKTLIPVLYDWFANHNLVWPTLSCRWGARFDEVSYKNNQRLYLSERTDGSIPNTLVIATAEIVKSRVAAAEHISQVEKAHSADIHCVDWNPIDLNLILTGSADNTVGMYDRRKLTSGGVQSPIHIFEGHAAAVLCVQWSPMKASVFGTSAEDGILNIWDHTKSGDMEGGSGTGNSGSPGLFFQHAGHRDKVVDFHWNASDPWTIVSVSDDAANNGGGGTLQIWRIIDFLYRAEDDVVNEMDNYRSHILPCSSYRRK